MRAENPFDVSPARGVVLDAIATALARLDLRGRRLADGTVVADVGTTAGPLQLVFRLDTLGTLELAALFPFATAADLSDVVVQANLRLRLARLDFDAAARRVFLRAFLPLAWGGEPARTLPFLVTSMLTTADLLYPTLAAVAAGRAERKAVVAAIDATRDQLEAAVSGPASF